MVRKFIKKTALIIMATMMLTACGAEEENAGFDPGEYESCWTDEDGDLIKLIPSENSYIFRKADGRVGRGTYTVNNSQLTYDRFIYDLVKDGDDKFYLDQNGSTTDTTTDFAYVIWIDSDNITFESTDPVYADATFTREADSYGEEYDDG